MVISEAIYETCLPILNDQQLDEEERTEKIEEVLRQQLTSLSRPLEDVVLDILWRHRSAKNHAVAITSIRQPPVRPSSPSLLQSTSYASIPLTGSPTAGRASPALRSSFNGAAPAFIRSKSFGTSSPLSSARPSPRLAAAVPLPHSPSLATYAFNDDAPDRNEYGDYGSDTVDWLVNEELASRPSSSGTGSVSEGGLNAAAPAWIQPQANEMNAYDILRSVMGDGKSDEEIELALEANGYDLSSTIADLMGTVPAQKEATHFSDQGDQVLIGKAMTSSQAGSVNDSSSMGRSNVVCKYWLASGSCLRADCRFSHDLSSHICKYWLAGNCLAGDSCVFSHDPAFLMNRMALGDERVSTPPGQANPGISFQDTEIFPALQAPSQMPYNTSPGNQAYGYRYASSPRRQFESKHFPTNRVGSPQSSTGSRPSSRHRMPQTAQSALTFDDSEAFPTLSGAGIKVSKKHHGRRGGHGHNNTHKDNIPGSMADVVRWNSDQSTIVARKDLTRSKSSTNVSGTSSAIPAPQHIPWLETGAKADQAYLKARQEAFRHGALRNKFLQSAAQAWNRNDARAAKALSLRGQSENDLMRKAHREAAHVLYDSRNKNSTSSPEIYVDLHGLHPDEAIGFLEDKLLEQQKSGKTVYAITGTGHHSRNGKDKVGKAVSTWLGEWKYAFREFSAAGAEGMGGILGIDPNSFDKSLLSEKHVVGEQRATHSDVGSSTKVRVVKAEDREGSDDITQGS